MRRTPMCLPMPERDDLDAWRRRLVKSNVGGRHNLMTANRRQVRQDGAHRQALAHERRRHSAGEAAAAHELVHENAHRFFVAYDVRDS